MSEIAIKVENLSKLYRIGVKEEKYKTLAGTLNNFIKAPLSNFRRLQSLKNFKNPDSKDVIWALKDINFEIKQGEAVGIIGRNGAGKSTLLKILSRITDPTQGRITINGRVASLLEVGTGFNAELTGRENIYLNGTILGMRRREIDRKLDEIIDFSGVEKFIDTPVKRYSSGMYVRLAFSVAAHLDTQILLVDEVLAVGDADFQNKCLGKMDEVSKHGRTVIFVSHTMSLINKLCKSCILLDKGLLRKQGLTNLVVKDYLENQNNDKYINPNIKKTKPQIISVTKIAHEDIIFQVELFCPSNLKLSLDIRITDSQGVSVGFGSVGTFAKTDLLELVEGINIFNVKLETFNFAIGSYYASFDIAYPNDEYYDRAENVISFDVARKPKDNEWRILMQNWNFGSIQIPVTLIK